jgi:hypothetical protein
VEAHLGLVADLVDQGADPGLRVGQDQRPGAVDDVDALRAAPFRRPVGGLVGASVTAGAGRPSSLLGLGGVHLNSARERRGGDGRQAVGADL